MPTGIYQHKPNQGFQKGQKVPWVKTNPQTFKKGKVPWNKNKKGIMPVPWNKELRGYNAGELHPQWNGGVTPIYAQIRNCLKYSEWRLKVYTRDLFTCQDCGESGVRLNADHIKPFALICKENNVKILEDAMNCEELWDIKNGKTLCVICHRKTNTYGGRTKIKEINIC